MLDPRRLGSRRGLRPVTWIGLWILGRALMIVEIGFWTPEGHHYEDVSFFQKWSNIIVHTGSLPHEQTWQYPPGAALLLLVPRVSSAFQLAFIGVMLLCDLAILVALWRLADEEGRDAGVWVWLLALPILAELPFLRFDLAPTLLVVVGLVFVARRPAVVGALAGLGASIKLWPLFLLLGERDRAGLLRAGAAALATLAIVFGGTALFFGNSLAFVKNGSDRGLQDETVASLPWKVRELATGQGQPLVARNGANEIVSGPAKVAVTLLDLATVVVLLAACLWWWLRERGIRRGREDLAAVALGRDLVFAVVLWFVVVSRVFSPQYMVWLVGLACVLLCTRGGRLIRPAWIVVAATVPTVLFLKAPAEPVAIVVRNLAILYAALESAWILGRSVAVDPARATERRPDLAPSAWDEGRRSVT